MQPVTNNLGSLIRSDLLNQEGVSKFMPNRRFATLYLDGSPAESVFFLDSGIVKIYKRGDDNKELILRIAGPGELIGERALGGDHTRCASAEILQEGVLYVIPRPIFLAFAGRHPEVWQFISEMLMDKEREMDKKVELLCLQDVEYRILYYMAELAGRVGTPMEGGEFGIPLSQSELAGLIGATRETTSTTLNSLARRNLIRLGRRQLIVPSIDAVRGAAIARSTRAAAN